MLGDHHFIFSATAQRLSEYLVMVIESRKIQKTCGRILKNAEGRTGHDMT